jgi:hypothetical protein
MTEDIQKENCIVCQLPRAYAHCGNCKGALCKSCEHFLDPDSFSFLETVPEKLRQAHYCPTCFDAEITPVQEKYDATMALARDINVFFLADKNLPRLLKKANNPIQVHNCRDRDETILRLGFRAAELGFNSIVKVDLIATQIRNITHQTSSWRGSGIPANIDVAKYFR